MGLDLGRQLVFTAELRGAESYNRDLDTTGFKSLLAAFNFEEAGQYAQATAAYLNALGSQVLDLPVKLIGERLAAIKKDHSMEYTAVAQGVYAGVDGGGVYHGRYYTAANVGEDAASPTANASPAPTPIPASTPPTEAVCAAGTRAGQISVHRDFHCPATGSARRTVRGNGGSRLVRFVCHGARRLVPQSSQSRPRRSTFDPGERFPWGGGVP